MNQINQNHFRIVAIVPSTRGVGFAVLEGNNTLADWGVKSANGESKNAKSLAGVKELITDYQPDVLILEDATAKNSQRSQRIRKLGPQTIKLAAIHKVKVKLFSRDQVMKILIPNGQGTKQALAEIIAQQFPDELGAKLPPKRKAWMREHYQIGIFDAVALALAFSLKCAFNLRHKQP
jgi:Holliday junction resolvasome RuvABC endonuclease subunit